MLKSQLINLIGRKQDHFPEEDIASSINTVLDKMASHLVQGGRIEIRVGTVSSLDIGHSDL